MKAKKREVCQRHKEYSEVEFDEQARPADTDQSFAFYERTRANRDSDSANAFDDACRLMEDACS